MDTCSETILVSNVEKKKRQKKYFKIKIIKLEVIKY